MTTTFYASFMTSENGRRQVGLFKRDDNAGEIVDSYLSRSLEWKWDKSGTLWSWILGRGDGDFEEQSDRDAAMFIETLKARGNQAL